MSIDKTQEKILQELNSIKSNMVTKADLQAVKDDLQATEKRLGNHVKTEIQSSEKRLKKHIVDEVAESNAAIKSGVDGLQGETTKRFDKLEAGQRELKDDVNNLKWDATTKKEFNELKAKVDRYHPPN